MSILCSTSSHASGDDRNGHVLSGHGLIDVAATRCDVDVQLSVV